MQTITHYGIHICSILVFEFFWFTLNMIITIDVITN